MKTNNSWIKNLYKAGVFLMAVLGLSFSKNEPQSIIKQEKPNVIFVFADQWRAQDVGFNGNKMIKTPALDKLANESLVFTNAVSGIPVCAPYRASLLTGQYPLTHGVFINDKPLNPESVTFGKIYKEAGYETAYIGKWHLNGREKGETMLEARKKFIPRERRQGFDFWQVSECTHNYMNSFYYEDTDELKKWDGYDAIAQTESAINYISEKSKGDAPFILFLSWGPPHGPYHLVPEQYKEMYPPEAIEPRPNVPDELKSKAQFDISGYYAHISALDDCINKLLLAIDKAGIAENTLFVFTSDHGDMLYSQGEVNKQRPWEESIMVPFLLRYPEKLGMSKRTIEMPINTPDILPTLLGLSGIKIPSTVEGTDYSKVLLGNKPQDNDAVLLQCPVPFHNYSYERGGREFRGVRTLRYTYVRDLDGPWLLYDNWKDPYQLSNLINNESYLAIQDELEVKLQKLLIKTNDKFLPGSEYVKMWNY